MRGISEVRSKENVAIEVLTQWQEDKKWARFFQVYLLPFVINMTTLMSVLDPTIANFMELLSTTTPAAFMTIIDNLCGQFEALSLDNLNCPVRITFDQISPYKDREELLSFSEIMERYMREHSSLTEEMVGKLYILRNFYLMKYELQQLFIDIERNEHSEIQEFLPTILLEKLGLVQLFPF